MDNAKTNKRLGIKVPRSTLLPPYLLVNPYYVEYADSIDAVLGPEVDDKIAIISNIRNMWVQNPTTEESVQAHTLISPDEWSVPERAIVVQQANLLGMKLRNAGVVSDDAYQTITRFVGQYWFGKGTGAFIEFINYCLSSDLELSLMWTENYVDFFEEGDISIGTPVWDGGTWYPTTHVTITANGGLGDLSIFTLQSFFYEIANYNLVLLAIDASFKMPIVDSVGLTDANVLAAGLYCECDVPIANFDNTGALPPPEQEMPEQKPTTYYAMNSVPADFNTAFLLAEPSGWMTVDNGTKIVPIYNKAAQTVRHEADVGIRLLGYTKLSNAFDLLYGPIIWIPVPGSSHSLSRVPSYSTDVSTILDGVEVSAKSVGVSRTLLLVNPLGFFEIVPGSFVPYW